MYCIQYSLNNQKVLHHPEMSPEEYHNHIDALMLKYHQLEEDMKGQHGGLMEQVDQNLLHQHGHPHYHSGFDSKIMLCQKPDFVIQTNK